MVDRDTGSPRADAESDFLRARRGQRLSALASFVRRDDQTMVQPLSFTEVVDALGSRGTRRIGQQVVPLDRIIGSVDKTREFDHRFRPTSGRHRQRWEGIARAMRTGASIPPIEVFQVGQSYFVADGHHRVSVSRALGLGVIDAYVTVVDTAVDPASVEGHRDIDTVHFRRLLLQRVPLPLDVADEVVCSEPMRSALIAEMAEAWSARQMHADQAYADRVTMAARWFYEEFRPTVRMMRDADLVDPDETDADAYIRVAGERYRLIRAHVWNEEVIRRLRELRRAGPG